MQTIMFTHSAHVHFNDKIRFRLFVGCYKHSSARWTLARAFCALGSFCPWIGHKPKQNQTQKIYTPNKTRKWSKIGSGGLALRISLIRACFLLPLHIEVCDICWLIWLIIYSPRLSFPGEWYEPRKWGLTFCVKSGNSFGMPPNPRSGRWNH